MSNDGDLVDVRLLELPVDVWSLTQQHTDELLREFTLMTSSAPDGEDPSHEVPRRLLELVEVLTASYSDASDEPRRRLFAAAEAGQTVIDELRYRVPPEVGEASLTLGAMLDEADDYCRAGQHLLTLATPPDLVRFRQWYLGEFAAQVHGRPPVPWPLYRG